MTLVVTASPPKIEITDTNGHVVFNTTEKLFYYTDRLQGSRSIAERITPVNNFTETFNLGACHSGSTFVRGAGKISGYVGTTNFNIPINIWFNVGGSYVHAQNVNYVDVLTFTAAAGAVTLTHKVSANVVQNSSGQNYNTLGYTIVYDLFVGGFT